MHARGASPAAAGAPPSPRALPCLQAAALAIGVPEGAGSDQRGFHGSAPLALGAASLCAHVNLERRRRRVGVGLNGTSRRGDIFDDRLDDESSREQGPWQSLTEYSPATSCLAFLGVLGLVPHAVWTRISARARMRLAAQMTRHRTDGFAIFRYGLALLGALLLFRALFGTLSLLVGALGLAATDVPNLGTGSTDLLWTLPLQGLYGLGIISFVLRSTEPEAPEPEPASQFAAPEPQPLALTLAAPSMRPEVEALERSWQLPPRLPQ
mmetsp:Transcript_106711/g.300399  ORF Transcript_106711/g.300399 Transcript_106711/m.300399 type:complete len:267 (-) Transcript_106711:145-945(-)